MIFSISELMRVENSARAARCS